MNTLFVDFDGTICHDKFWRGLGETKAALVQSFIFEKNQLLVNQWMCGKYTSEDVNEYISKETGFEFQTLWNIFVDDCKTMSVDQDLLSLIVELRNKFKVVLITGNMDCFDRFTVPALKLEKYFDIIVNSYNEGQLKYINSGETFSEHIKGHFKNAYLVDDSSISCDIFCRLGGTALHVTKSATAHSHLENLLSLSTTLRRDSFRNWSTSAPFIGNR
ncbi:MAG: hypothetical protein V7750_04750 [Sneathiella sp.]